MSAWLDRHLSGVVALLLVGAFVFSAFVLRDASIKRHSACVDLEALKTISRNEKEQQVANTTRILLKHKGEQSVFGIPRRLLEDNRADTRVTIRQLAPKGC